MNPVLVHGIDEQGLSFTTRRIFTWSKQLSLGVSTHRMEKFPPSKDCVSPLGGWWLQHVKLYDSKDVEMMQCDTGVC